MATAKKTEKVDPPESVEPTPEPTPEPPQPTYEPPEKYQGKSLEEVIKMNEEAQKQIGRQGDDLGRERKEKEKAQQDLNYFQTWYQNQQGKTEEQPQSPAVNFDYDNPIQSVDERIEQKLNRWAGEQKKQQQQQEYQEASQHYMRGRIAAFQGNQSLYEGIEQETGMVVWNAYLSRAISKIELGDPTTWEDAAWIIHKKRKNWDKLVPPKVKPVSPTPTETPAGVKPGLSPEEKPVIFREDSKEIIRGLGDGKFKEKEVAEMVKKSRKERAEQEG